MTIQYEIDRPLTVGDVAALFRSSGLRRPVDDLDRLEQMLTHANLTLSAWDGERLVGLARALTDFSYCCYLSDLAVAADYQRQGIGRELLRRLQEELGEQVMLLLLAAPDANTYYAHLGFEKHDRAWHIPRER